MLEFNTLLKILTSLYFLYLKNNTTTLYTTIAIKGTIDNSSSKLSVKKKSKVCISNKFIIISFNLLTDIFL